MAKTKKLVKKGGMNPSMRKIGTTLSNKNMEKGGVVLNRMKKQIFVDQTKIPEQPESELIDGVNCLKIPCEEVGQGNFGEVYKASYKPIPNEKAQNVVLKVLKDENNKEDFDIEKTIGLLLRGHKNVLKLYGEAEFPNSKERCLVFEFCSNGDLLKYLRKPKKIMNYNKKLVILKQICEGMEYIHSKNVLHRDLGARNILLDDCLTAKVADFGMSKDVGSLQGVLKGGYEPLGSNPTYEVPDPQKQPTMYQPTYGFGSNTSYTRTKQMLLPIRWCSPEILKEGKFSKKSDIWAFGVTCYEIFTNGDVPYNNEINNQEVGKLISSNKEMAVVSLQSNIQFNDITDLMRICFQGKIEQFADLNNEIKTLSRNNSNNNKISSNNKPKQLKNETTYEYIEMGEPFYSSVHKPLLKGGSRKKKRTLKKKRKQSKKTKSRKARK
jgi:serine/threonine protein kinase